MTLAALNLPNVAAVLCMVLHATRFCRDFTALVWYILPGPQEVSGRQPLFLVSYVKTSGSLFMALLTP